MIYHQPESKDAHPFYQFGSNEMTPKMKSIISKGKVGDFFFFSNTKLLDRDFKVYNSVSFAIIIKYLIIFYIFNFLTKNFLGYHK